MRDREDIVKSVHITSVQLEDINTLIKEHIDSLTFPMDSWLDDRLLEASKWGFFYQDVCIGYAGINQTEWTKETLNFFHVKKEYLRIAPFLLEKVIEEKAIKQVLVLSQDAQLCALIAEWDFEKEKQACWFTDNLMGESIEIPPIQAIFRVAVEADNHRIKAVSGNFFEEESGGFTTLAERIAAGTIFLLMDSESILGCGIVEKGKFRTDVVSIGMYTPPKHRRKGVAKTILLNLKKWAYENAYVPVAGCWYYNTLSRQSLESAGMIATSIGYLAILNGKEKLPLRTGNPPGESV